MVVTWWIWLLGLFLLSECHWIRQEHLMTLVNVIEIDNDSNAFYSHNLANRLPTPTSILTFFLSLSPPPRKLCVWWSESVCLFVCLSVCLLVTLHKKRMDFDEIFRIALQWYKEQSIKIWCWSESSSWLSNWKSRHYSTMSRAIDWIFGVNWITLLTLQIWNSGNIGVMGCPGRGLRSVSVLGAFFAFCWCMWPAKMWISVCNVMLIIFMRFISGTTWAHEKMKHCRWGILTSKCW